MFIGIGYISTNEPIQVKPEYEYTLRISNWVGSQYYQYDYYIKNVKTYELYNKDSVLINEIKPSNGNTIIITKND